jgi:hypothetical protein
VTSQAHKSRSAKSRALARTGGVTDGQVMSLIGTFLPCQPRRLMSEVDAVDGSSTGT